MGDQQREIESRAVFDEPRLLALAQSVLAQERRRQSSRLASEWRRAWTPTAPPQPCEICNQWEGMTHAHHLYPLAEQAFRGWAEPDHTFVWLCPNHHILVHRIADGSLTDMPAWVEEITWTMASSLAEYIAKVSDPLTELHAWNMRKVRDRWKQRQVAANKGGARQ